jgi:hypothetical protein
MQVRGTCAIVKKQSWKIGAVHTGELHLTAALQFLGVQKEREDQRIPMALAPR